MALSFSIFGRNNFGFFLVFCNQMIVNLVDRNINRLTFTNLGNNSLMKINNLVFSITIFFIFIKKIKVITEKV